MALFPSYSRKRGLSRMSFILILLCVIFISFRFSTEDERLKKIRLQYDQNPSMSTVDNSNNNSTQSKKNVSPNPQENHNSKQKNQEEQDKEQEENQEEVQEEDQEQEQNSSFTCLPFQNSDTWLNSPRFSNIDEDNLTHELVESLIMNVSPLHTNDGSKDVLDQTMCLDGSRFLNWESVTANQTAAVDKEDKTIEFLSYKLIYLAIHEHQHRLARKEAISRYSPSCRDKVDGIDNGNNLKESNDSDRTTISDLKKANVGKFDFECPDAKYVVSMLPNIGFGASLRLAVPDPVFLGLLTRRVTLFMNTLPSNVTKLESLTKPWILASCPRGDLQCMFLPLSPCTITYDDLTNAPILSDEDLDEFRQKGELDQKYANEKVVIMEPFLNGHKPVPFGLGDALVNIISSLYSDSNEDNPKFLDLETTITPPKTNWLLGEDVLQEVYSFIQNLDLWTLHVLTMFYVVRPNLYARNEIDKLVNKAFPSGFNYKSTIGLPIRGTDKCIRESQCLSFDQYMQLIKEFGEKRTKQYNQLDKNGDNDGNHKFVHDTVILTSESKDILQSRLAYTPRNESFPFDFIINEDDPGQGSGNPNSFKSMNSFTPDDVMISSLVSMKMQIHAESMILNSCSNFHILIGTLVHVGCGMTNYSEVMSNNDNPKFRLRCGW